LIPFGQTRCYSELGPARAVGQACHRNRFPYLVPCHRVVGKGGNLGGYAFGSDIKSLLLAEESSCQARKQQTISEPEPFFSFLAEQKELRALLEQPLQSVLLQKE
jgi:O-6-methylguanine DNA methyltransferase